MLPSVNRDGTVVGGRGAGEGRGNVVSVHRPSAESSAAGNGRNSYHAPRAGRGAARRAAPLAVRSSAHAGSAASRSAYGRRTSLPSLQSGGPYNHEPVNLRSNETEQMYGAVVRAVSVGVHRGGVSRRRRSISSERDARQVVLRSKPPNTQVSPESSSPAGYVSGGGAASAASSEQNDSGSTGDSTIRNATSVFGSACLPGVKPGRSTPWRCQDAVLAIHPFNGRADVGLFAVFDGHGSLGHRVSALCRKRLPIQLRSRPFLTDPAAALSGAIVGLHRDLVDSAIDVTLSGTTCVALLIVQGLAVVANCGDSRCILGHSSGARAASFGTATGPLASSPSPGPQDKQLAVTAPAPAGGGGGEGSALTLSVQPLSEDHKPETPAERRRIEAAGGAVHRGMAGVLFGNACPLRVYCRMGEGPGLAMSRSLGDALAHSVGVSATPTVQQHRLGPEDKVLVLASDGIWDFVSNEEVVAEAALAIEPTANNGRGGGGALLKTCDKLSKMAQGRWLESMGGSDDISVLLIRCSPFLVS